LNERWGEEVPKNTGMGSKGGEEGNASGERFSNRRGEKVFSPTAKGDECEVGEKEVGAASGNPVGSAAKTGGKDAVQKGKGPAWGTNRQRTSSGGQILIKRLRRSNATSLLRSIT